VPARALGSALPAGGAWRASRRGAKLSHAGQESWSTDACNGIVLCGQAGPAFEGPIDTSTSAGKCFLDMLGVFAEFETNLRRERQLEGIAKAKAAGVYKGRPASIDAAQVRAMKAQGLGASEIAKGLRIGRASVYRVLDAR
jgi:Resolvase, N terminal domain/Helix-turn-helix domain of resolvase